MTVEDSFRVTAELDHLLGVFGNSLKFSSVTIGAIADLVARLDAKTHSLLSLGASDGRTLMIGGGQGQYVVCRMSYRR
jgi:hypothetical protein